MIMAHQGAPVVSTSQSRPYSVMRTLGHDERVTSEKDLTTSGVTASTRLEAASAAEEAVSFAESTAEETALPA